jgi:hypothetical protein
MTDPVYIEMVERLLPKLPNAPDGILAGSMMMALRRKMGEQPPEIFDCLDRGLTDALRIVRQRDRVDSAPKTGTLAV